MITPEQQALLNDASLSIYLNKDGTIVFQSGFEQQWKEAGGDFDELVAAIEDSIFQTDDGDEDIDWAAVECEMEAEV